MKCPSCEKDPAEIEPVEDGEPGMVMCLDCGEEFTPADPRAQRFANYAVAKVMAVRALKGALKAVDLDVGQGADALVQVTTNAKHVAEGELVVVALEGAIVPAGKVVGEDPDAIEIKPTSVGGVKSAGMLCDSPMLGWVGGAKGVLQKLDAAAFSPGDLPPLERPR